MSDLDDERKAHRMNIAVPNRGRKFGLIAVVFGVVVLIVFAGVAASGILDPITKRAILKANDMESITGIEGRWEQASLHCFEGDVSFPYGSEQAAHSICAVSNGTAGLAVAITVAAMNDSQQAELIYEGIIAQWSASKLNRSLLDIGDSGFLSGYFDPDADLISDAYVHFRKGVYLVEIYHSGSLTTRDMCIEIARAQAARL